MTRYFLDISMISSIDYPITSLNTLSSPAGVNVQAESYTLIRK
jgi:hypothetical protein